ncbi:hypothetical protein CYMTET_49829 [Cymbomonas tetramitiformis]|uniref:Uncharacterized protein n=1 Tax=Cymbomonas tetramitiformis TaxID=36881 RepID=A0AAE0BPC0_9CHLO|nr:hypothetical protein CYMTET_49829 [Cymbomonas tetramitiformis]
MQNEGREQWQQRGRGPAGMEESREAEDRRNMHTIQKEFSVMEPATLARFSDGAKIPLPLREQFAEQRTQAVKRTQSRDKTATDSAALEQFYSEKLEDVRLRYTKRAKGFPLEKPHGVLDEQGHIRYSLLKNCAAIDGHNLDKNGFPTDSFHITVGPLRAYPPQAVEFLSHIETVIRILHGESGAKKIVCRKTPPRPRFAAGRVAGSDIKFTDTAYAVTALATTLPLIPLNCYPIGHDLFTQDDLVFPRVRIYDPAGRGGSDSRMLHVISNELKGKVVHDLEEDLLKIEGLESVLTGHRLQGRVAAKSANWVKFVMVSEEAAQKIESKTELFPGLDNYEVQRVASIREVDKQTETEVAVVDAGNHIDPEFEVEALTSNATSEYFKKVLGNGEHLLPQLAVPTYPATDPKDVASYARYRQLYKGRLYNTFIVTDDAYRWLVAQEGSQAKIGVVHKGMYFLIRPSDYSKQGKGRRGRQTRAAGITRDEAVVQALESKLGNFADAVKAATSSRSDISGDAETAIKDLGEQVKGLSEKVEKGFKDTVDSVKKVNASVDSVDDKGVKQVIDLTSTVLTRQDKHLALADKQNKVADAMLQQLIAMNGAAAKTPATGTGAVRRGSKRVAGTPNSDTGEDTDMDLTPAEVMQLKKMRKESIKKGGRAPK